MKDWLEKMRTQKFRINYHTYIIEEWNNKYKVIAPNGNEWLEDTIEEAKLVIDAEVE